MVRILILGKGQVGGALLKGLKSDSHTVIAAGKHEIDLSNESSSMKSIMKYEPELIILAAGISRGYLYNKSHQFKQFQENSRINSSALLVAHAIGARLINILPSCIYPKKSENPHKPEDIFRSQMEESSLGYSSAKISSAVAVWAHNQEHQTRWLNVVLTNLYGSLTDEPGAHLIPHAIMQILDARSKGLSRVVFNGSGKAIRDFLHVSDLTRAAPIIVEEKLHAHTKAFDMINIAGMGPITIRDVCQIIASQIGFNGEIVFSEHNEQGADSKQINGEVFSALGWKPSVDIEMGIKLCLRQLRQ